MASKTKSAIENNHVLIHDPNRRKYLPPFCGSPFGDFPPDFNNPMQQRTLMAEKKARRERQAAKQPLAHQFLKSHSGNGGETSSTRHGKEPEKPKKPVAGAFRKKKIVVTEFRRFYERGDLPVSIQHTAHGRTLHWKVDIEKLDYHHYLPIFFDGLRELEEPFKFIAFQGCQDLLKHGKERILPTVPQLIIPIKTALNSRDPEIICSVLQILSLLVTSGELVGEALVPYYRQILPVMNLFHAKNINLGDAIDYGQRKRNNLGDLIQDTLALFEAHGGEDAFINIKYMIPTYESAVIN
jgi:hypothetical protein